MCFDVLAHPTQLFQLIVEEQPTLVTLDVGGNRY